MKKICPTCNKKVLATEEKGLAPFCSKRCKIIDLGGWLSEKYVVKTDEKPENEEEPS